MLTPEAIDYARRSVLCWLATVDSQGVPNVSPKEAFAPFDSNYVVIANIRSPGSVRNIATNPKVCVSYLDIFVQKGFKVYGTAEHISSDDERYQSYEQSLLHLTGDIFPIQGIIAVRVESFEPIIAPSYFLIPGTTEASQIAAAMATYGVKKG